MKSLKHIYLLIAGTVVMFSAFAQAPTGVNYQAVARNASGVMVNKSLGVRISILAGSTSGSADYVEKHSVTTNQYGLFNLVMGSGSAQSGTFAGISWGSGSKFLKVEIDSNNGSNYTTLSNTQMMSVPYALYAEKSGGGSGVTGSGTANYVARFSGSTALGNSLIYDNGSQISIGTTSPSSTNKFEVNTSSYDAVNGISSSTYNGVFGSNSGAGNGVQGSNTSTGNGVYGEATSGAGIFGTSSGGYGVIGICSTANYAGVVGRNSTTSPGVYGANSSSGIGVLGVSTSGNGVAGVSSTAGYVGVYGSNSTSGPGVYGVNSGSGAGVYGYNSGSGDAGYFAGDVTCTGTMAKAGGSFKIDHPQDPANKYLVHSFVESPDMMNVYNGNITTDANGLATVKLPTYFMAENKDFRYQLTVIGTFAQAIVFEEVKDNQFVIKTDKPNVKVSWQVTGIRQDAWANANRIPTEVEKKGEEKGHYLHPTLFGQPISLSISALNRPFAPIAQPLLNTVPTILQRKTLGKY